MSSTNRGAVRAESDFYSTPEWVTRAILPHLPRGTFGDLGCGDGAIVRAIIACTGIDPSRVAGIEIDQARAQAAATTGAKIIHGDALAEWPWLDVDTIVMNPPFSAAQLFVERALALQAPNRSTVAALLRLSFLASKKRVAFWRANPADVYVLPKRPSFTGGGTDSCDYMWAVWGPGRGGRWFVLEAG